MMEFAVVTIDSWSTETKIELCATKEEAKELIAQKYLGEIFSHECCEETKTFISSSGNYAQFSEDGMRIKEFRVSEIG